MSRALRLVSFNILEGLQPVPRSEAERRLLIRGRVEAAKAIVADLKPEILVLNEALFCQEQSARRSTTPYCSAFLIASRLYTTVPGEMQFEVAPHCVFARDAHLQSWWNYRGHRYPVRSPHRCVVPSHPHRHPATRLSTLPSGKGVDGPLIVCGDLNSISPEDEIDRDQLVEAFRAFSQDPETMLSVL